MPLFNPGEEFREYNLVVRTTINFKEDPMKQSPDKNAYSMKIWSLKDLFAGVDDPALEKAFKSLEKDVKTLESQRPVFHHGYR